MGRHLASVNCIHFSHGSLHEGVIQRLNNIIPGDRVKIERGPFAEFICTVDSIQDDRRAWVLINLLQQKTRAEVSLDAVSKVN